MIGSAGAVSKVSFRSCSLMLIEQAAAMAVLVWISLSIYNLDLKRMVNRGIGFDSVGKRLFENYL